jgi:hypothetical protein
MFRPFWPSSEKFQGYVSVSRVIVCVTMVIVYVTMHGGINNHTRRRRPKHVAGVQHVYILLHIIILQLLECMV